jgi:preprotein translocase subunit SecA
MLPYPQRRVRPMNWTDRALFRAGGALVTGLTPRRLGRRRFIAAVEQARAGAMALPADAMLRAAQALRARIARQGLPAPLRIEAFGLACAAFAAERGFPHRPVQIYGASLLLDGRLLEMATGEGKTATAVLAAAVAGLAGFGPHVITVNDYLAARDHEESAGVFARLGLSCGLVTGDMAPPARRAAYACDVVYVNNKDIAFDYLKDLLALDAARAAPRAALRAALGDPARPDAAPRPLLLRGLRLAIVDEADSILVDEARTPLIISAPEGAAPDPEDYLTALRLARGLAEGRDFTLSALERRVRLTDAGRAALGARAARLDGVWRIPRAREDRVRQALSALHLFQRDTHYLVGQGDDGPAIHIIDEFTGRTMPDRSWEGGLHQMVEVKEGIAPTAPRRTIARVTYQRFFRQYLRLSAMTGTGMEIAAEMRATYGLRTVAVPTHRPVQRRHLGITLLPDAAAKAAAIAARTADLAARGRAVLIGTRTVAASEDLARALARAGVAHRILNARQNVEEADLIAGAGAAGAVTIATNMAGRGTDIKLGPGVAQAGGLHVILTEYHESRRIDRQLYGRAGRQGDPGSCEDIVALDDPLFTRYAPGLLARLSALPRSAATARLLRRVMQARAEAEAAVARRWQVTQERDLARMLAIAGREHG